MATARDDTDDVNDRARTGTGAAQFDFAFDIAHLLSALPFGVTPWTTEVVVDGRHLGIRFGPWFVGTTLDNVVGSEPTGPFSFVKTAGPARLSLADRGLTFASNDRRGLCIRFAQPVTGIDPLGRIRHPAVTVTVSHVDELAEALRA